MPVTRRALKFAAAVVPLLLVLACVALPRYKAVDSSPEPYPVERLAEELDPWLLAEGFAEGLIVEIDWVESCEPGPRTVAGLERTLERYLPDGMVFEVVTDEEIPRAVWDEAVPRGEPVQAIVERFATTGPGPDGGVERAYALFVPDAGRMFGYASTWTVERDGRVGAVRGVVVSRSAHQRYAWLWLDLDRMERMTLIHEFGHVLGLVTNDRHERAHPDHRRHCNRLKCVMAHPTWRVIARNAPAGLFNVFLRDYCKACREDIRRAQEYWRRQVAAGPAYREARSRARAGARASMQLQPLYREDRYAELLARARALREEFPEGGWDEVEADALVGLGRLDEALTLLARGLDADPDSASFWSQRWKLGRLLMALGRHAEVPALFDDASMNGAAPYALEHSAFVLEQALVGLGRYAEAAARLDELLERGHPLSMSAAGLRVHVADLLRRAGDLAGADRALARVPRKERTDRWLRGAAALRDRQGRSAEAAALRRELLEMLERGGAQEPPAMRWWREWNAVELRARTGDRQRALAAAEKLATQRLPEGIEPSQRLAAEAPAWIALGELGRAAEIVRALRVPDRRFFDPCGLEALEPLRRSPDHSPLLAHCPARAGDAAPGNTRKDS